MSPRNPDLPYTRMSFGGAEYASVLGRVHADAGNTEEATRVLNRLRERRREEYVPATFLATVQIGLDDTDGALASLAQAATEHSYYVPWWNLDPALDVLRSDPRFSALRKSAGLAR